jgi:hypothetical protein
MLTTQIALLPRQIHVFIGWLLFGRLRILIFKYQAVLNPFLGTFERWAL